MNSRLFSCLHLPIPQSLLSSRGWVMLLASPCSSTVPWPHQNQGYQRDQNRTALLPLWGLLPLSPQPNPGQISGALLLPVQSQISSVLSNGMDSQLRKMETDGHNLSSSLACISSPQQQKTLLRRAAGTVSQAECVLCLWNAGEIFIGLLQYYN